MIGLNWLRLSQIVSNWLSLAQLAFWLNLGSILAVEVEIKNRPSVKILLNFFLDLEIAVYKHSRQVHEL